MNKKNKKFLEVKKWTLERVWVKVKVILMLLIKQNMKNNCLEKWKIIKTKMINKNKRISNSQQMIQTKWKWRMILEVKINNKKKIKKRKKKRMINNKRNQIKILKI